MIKVCLWCKKEYEAKKESSKYCSTSCRVMYNRKPATKGTISKLDIITIYNEFKAAIQEFGNVKVSAPLKSYDAPKMPISTKDEFPQYEQPKIMFFSDYYDKVGKAKTIPEIEKLVDKAFKDENVAWPERYKLKNYGIELSKNLYSD